MTLVRELSRRAGRPADEAEVRAALAPLSAAQEAALRKLGKGAPPATPLGPRAWADIARGTSAAVAAARELGGFYELQAERDALASMVASVRAQKPALSEEEEAEDARDSAGEDDEREDRGDDDISGLDDDADSDDDEAPAKPAPARAAAKAPRDPFDDEPLPSPAKASRKAASAKAAGKVRPPPDAIDRVLAGAPVAAKPLPPADKKARAAAYEERSQQVLTLFAYHRDSPLVARALGMSMDQLEQEVDLLKIRRQSRALLRGTDIELPKAASRAGAAASEPVRRRAAGSKEAAKKAEKEAKEAEAQARAVLAAAKAAAPEPEPVREEVEELPPPPPRGRLPVKPAPGQAEPLKALLREVGPRRKVLCEKLGTGRSPLSTAALLARFRAAGLEREFGQRERDLVRALLSRHRGALAPAAEELGLSPKELQDVVRERGLTREVETLRDQQRRDAREAKWPQGRIELWLRQGVWLTDLGLWDELDKEIDTRVRLAWKGLPPAGKKRSALLARNLRIAPADAEALVVKLKLT